MVGLCASCLPQVRPRVNTCGYVNNTNVFPCARVGLVLDWGGPKFNPGGRGLTRDYYCCSLSGTKKVQIRKKRG